MNRYKGKAARWQQQDKEEQRMNKTEFIKVRCTSEEKKRIKSRAESTGRKFSDYCREILLNGEVTAVPKMTDNERMRGKPLPFSSIRAGSMGRFPTLLKSRMRDGYISHRTFRYVPKKHLSGFTTLIFVWMMRYIRS